MSSPEEHSQSKAELDSERMSVDESDVETLGEANVPTTDDTPDYAEGSRVDSDGQPAAAVPIGIQIHDVGSFTTSTSEDKAVAGLYAYMHLDVLIELARKVSFDFFDRPEIYRDERVDDVAVDLARIRVRYGTDERYLSWDQRHIIYASIFGEAEAALHGTPLTNSVSAVSSELTMNRDRFAPERDQLLAASAAFAERVFNTGERPLRDTVAVMAPGLRSYLNDLNRAMVQWARNEALPEITENSSYKILRNPGICAAFGLENPSENWPYRQEENGDTLVAVISSRLSPEHTISQDRFIDCQRLALRGGEAIAALLNTSDGPVEDASLDLLISKCYTWYAARGRALGVPLATVAVATDNSGRPMGSLDGYQSNRSLFASSVPELGR
jgi:hypothetical protein